MKKKKKAFRGLLLSLVVCGCFIFGDMAFMNVKAAVAGSDAPVLDGVKYQAINGGNPIKEELVVEEGDVVTYTIEITNTGTKEANDVIIKDCIPKEFVSCVSNITGDGILTDDGIITWNIASIKGNETTISVSFDVIIPCIDKEMIWTNQATYGDGNVDDKKTNEVVIKAFVPVLKASKSQSLNGDAFVKTPLVVEAGDTVTYEIELINTGKKAAYDVFIVDRLPTDFVSYVSNIVGDGALSEDGTMEWHINTLNANEIVRVGFDVTIPDVKKDTTWTNVAIYYDTETRNETNKVKVTEYVPILSGEKYQSLNGGDKGKEELAAKAGDIITYVIEVTNTGTGTARDVIIKDCISADLVAHVKNISDNGVLSENGIITWHIKCMNGLTDNVPSTVTVTFDVILPSMDKDTVWENVATYGDGNQDESITDKVVVKQLLPVLEVEKTQAKGNEKSTKTVLSVDGNDIITYFVTVTNTGTSDTGEVVITDSIPVSLSGVELLLVDQTISDGGVVTNKTIRWEIDNLAPGEKKTVSFSVIVPTETVASKTIWTNVATVDCKNDVADAISSNEVEALAVNVSSPMTGDIYPFKMLIPMLVVGVGVSCLWGFKRRITD